MRYMFLPKGISLLTCRCIAESNMSGRPTGSRIRMIRRQISQDLGRLTPNGYDEAKAIIQPWLNDVEELGIGFEPKWNCCDSIKGVADNAVTSGSANSYGSVSGNRLFPRENFEGELLESTFDAIWNNTQAGYIVPPYNIAPIYERSSSTNNAVSPAWREAIAGVIMGATNN
jgi:hypothetical protein